MVTTRKKTPPHAEEKQKLSESVRKENVRGLKNAKSTLAKKNSASSTIRKPVDVIPKMVQKQESGSASKEMIHGERDSALISEKYENNVPKVLSKTDYQIVKNTDEIFDEIVRQFSFVVKKGGGEANIVLQPDILGKLKLNLKLNQHEVHSVIIVDNQSVKDLIISKLNILEQSLLQQGFTLGSFHVEVNDSEAGLNTEEHEIEKALKMSRDIDSDKEAVMNHVVMITPEWLSTIINVTA
jgi:flagellar hook-length control protein FliK